MTKPYTEDDVKLAVAAFEASYEAGNDADEDFARAILDALAAAGRLVPAGHTFQDGDILPALPYDPMYESPTRRAEDAERWRASKEETRGD